MPRKMPRNVEQWWNENGKYGLSKKLEVPRIDYYTLSLEQQDKVFLFWSTGKIEPVSPDQSGSE